MSAKEMARKGAKQQRFFLAKALKYSNIIYDKYLKGISLDNNLRLKNR
jgi:hypothetical protein